ncbi:hypothetical protein CkaCkLH20_11712 [Colletotrichum karsti]|uniref:Uncharacterized protein n=1 Tax=Colletotrichum karsti TaxID=1095194 RepID=A0A9P6HU89_9PEZI|nr:uncharacterized protein CkaCkLH20_11712 [Colletotrichum karsti]KAF9870813.1 hypothetical protein CkaCkLH20_11712 [Colletotrichum karsti]
MPRKHKSNRRSTKHRQDAVDSDFSVDRRIVKDDSHSRGRRDRSSSKKRVIPDTAEQLRPRKHNKHRRYKLRADNDGDSAMPPTPPSSPLPADEIQRSYKRDSNGSNARRRHVPEIPTRQTKTSRGRQEPYGDSAIKNYRFRHHVLSLLDQQRDVIETWADSVGAGGPAEPMDWQPEQERIVYFARLPVEDNCYENRWRTDETKDEAPAFPNLGSWASERWLDGSMMWGGAPAVGPGLVEEIE